MWLRGTAASGIPQRRTVYNGVVAIRQPHLGGGVQRNDIVAIVVLQQQGRQLAGAQQRVQRVDVRAHMLLDRAAAANFRVGKLEAQLALWVVAHREY